MLNRISLARSILRSKTSKKREISLADIFKEELKLSRYESAIRKTWDPSSKAEL